MKKIVLAGGTGFIGSYLSKRFQQSGYQVVIISRKKEHLTWKHTDLVKAVNNADILINLAGKSINCRQTKKNRQLLIESRIDTTTWLGNAVKSCQNPPKLWINASAAGIYKSSLKIPMTEERFDYDTGFIAELVSQWENVFFGLDLPDMRRIALRTSVVLGKNAGALKPLSQLTKLGLGGKQGKGNQMFSWIHLEDFFRIILFLIENESLEGIFNCTAPEPVTNEKLMYDLRETLHMSMGINAPEFMVYLGAKIIGTEPSLLLNSSYLVPKRLTDNGFKFCYPDLHKALFEIFS